MKYILALDVGTTTIKALIFDKKMNFVAKVSRDLLKDFPKEGWVEQDPFEFVQKSKEVIREVFQISAIDPRSCVMGITNQRETTIIWDSKTGKPVYPAIVWEDSRTKEWCDKQNNEMKEMISSKTGLQLEPYFSASKIKWILDNYQGDKNNLIFGTVDSWILWNLDSVHPHLTDKTNASRTLLFNIYNQKWDDELISIFNINKNILPEAKESVSVFGELNEDIVGYQIPIVAMCGDQQSSMASALSICKSKNCTKVTLGTGVFIMQIITDDSNVDKKLFKTITPSLTGEVLYAVEAKINNVAQEVNSLLDKPDELDIRLKRLAIDIIDILKKLPNITDEIVVDGGVSRDGIVGQYIEELSGIKVKTPPIFDGTGYGVGMLIYKSDLNI